MVVLLSLTVINFTLMLSHCVPIWRVQCLPGLRTNSRLPNFRLDWVMSLTHTILRVLKLCVSTILAYTRHTFPYASYALRDFSPGLDVQQKKHAIAGITYLKNIGTGISTVQSQGSTDGNLN